MYLEAIHLSQKTCIMHEIRADFKCAQSRSFSGFAVRRLANSVGFLPSSVTHMAFQRAVNREFTLVSGILRSSRFTDQLIPPAVLPSSPAFPSSSTNTNMHMHKGNQIAPPPPTNFPDFPRLCFPSTSHLWLLFTLLPLSRVGPPPPSSLSLDR